MENFDTFWYGGAVLFAAELVLSTFLHYTYCRVDVRETVDEIEIGGGLILEELEEEEYAIVYRGKGEEHHGQEVDEDESEEEEAEVVLDAEEEEKVAADENDTVAQGEVEEEDAEARVETEELEEEEEETDNVQESE